MHLAGKETGVKYDLAIIGGGLAGLALAILEARTGQQVLLCEQKTYPAHKVCGEYISYESAALLEHLGVPLAAWQLPDIKRLQLTVPNYALELKLPLGGFGVSRYQLEANLVTLARAAGVEIREHCKVLEVGGSAGDFMLRTDQEEFKTNWVAGAWGRRSVLYKQVPQNRNYVGVKWHLTGPLPNDLIALHNFSGGYAGMSRIEDGKSCFCYLVDSRRLKAAGTIAQLEQQMRVENPKLDRMLAPMTPVWEEPLSIAQLSFLPKSRLHEGVLLLGDAAGSIAPLAGNGMSMALHAAWLLHQAWEKEGRSFVAADAVYRQYDAAWRKQFALRTSVSYRIQNIFGKVAPATALFRLVGTIPPLGQVLTRLTHGSAFGPLENRN